MNKLFTSSWVQNVEPLTEEQWMSKVIQILNEAEGDEPKRRGKKSDPRYGRLMGYPKVKELAGHMTPRYFATKVIRQLEKDFPDKKIDDITDEEMQQAMDVVAQMSRKLQMKPEVKVGTQKSETPGGASGVKKGKTGLETLHLNLEPDTKFTFEEETPMGHGLYVAKKGKYKYRVTVKDSNGKPMTLKDFDNENTLSVVVTEPQQKQSVSLPSTDEHMPSPKVEREKPVADFPNEAEDDFSGEDPEAAAYGRKEEDEIELSKCCHAPMEHGKCSQCGCDEEDEQLEMGDAQAHMQQQKEEDCEYDARDKERNGLAKEEDYDRLHNKSMSRANTTPNHLEDEDSEDEDCEMGEDSPHMVIKKTVVIKKSPQQINQELQHKFKERMRHNYAVDRKNGWGY